MEVGRYFYIPSLYWTVDPLTTGIIIAFFPVHLSHEKNCESKYSHLPYRNLPYKNLPKAKSAFHIPQQIKITVSTYITRDQTVVPWHRLGPSHFYDCHPAGCAHGRGQIFESKTTQQPTKTTMFQGRGMGRLGGRESAASIPSPCHIITSCCTRVVCSFVRWFVHLVGCCVVSLPLVVEHPNPLALPCHLVAASHLLSSSHCRQAVALPRLVSPLPTLLSAWCQRQRPPLLIFHGLMGLHGSMLVRWRVWVHMFWFGDCKQMRKFPFSDVPQNTFKIWEK